jgi:hypothetical protein
MLFTKFKFPQARCRSFVLAQDDSVLGGWRGANYGGLTTALRFGRDDGSLRLGVEEAIVLSHDSPPFGVRLQGWGTRWFVLV